MCPVPTAVIVTRYQVLGILREFCARYIFLRVVYIRYATNACIYAARNNCAYFLCCIPPINSVVCILAPIDTDEYFNFQLQVSHIFHVR